MGNDPAICVSNVLGAPCPGVTDFCAPGLFCERAQSAKEGICRPVRSGSPCQDAWQCPLTMACRKTGADTAICTPGKSHGELCEIGGPGIFKERADDCAYGLRCLSTDGGPPRCYGLSRRGEKCGFAPPVANGDAILLTCVPGSACEPSGGTPGVCVAPHLTEGATCTDNSECLAPAECRSRDLQNLVCVNVLDQVPIGGACGVGDSDRKCVFGAYCRVDLPGSLPITAHCHPYRRVDEPCSDDGREQCDFMLQCTAGICRGC
jgi:hypothetical protein